MRIFITKKYAIGLKVEDYLSSVTRFCWNLKVPAVRLVFMDTGDIIFS